MKEGEKKTFSYRSNIVLVRHDEDASILSDRHLRYLGEQSISILKETNSLNLTDTSHQSFVVRTW